MTGGGGMREKWVAHSGVVIKVETVKFGKHFENRGGTRVFASRRLLSKGGAARCKPKASRLVGMSESV